MQQLHLDHLVGQDSRLENTFTSSANAIGAVHALMNNVLFLTRKNNCHALYKTHVQKIGIK